MLLVKKCQIFLYLDLVKIRLEKVSNNILEEKETFFYYKNTNFSQSQKSHFSKGVNPCFWSKNVFFFLELFSVKIRPEIMFNNVLERKETFFGHKKSNLSKSQKSHFSKGVNPCFWSKNWNFFLYLFSVKKGLEIRLNDVLDRKQTFFD